MPLIKDSSIRERNTLRIYGCSEAEAIALNGGVALRTRRSWADRYCSQRGRAAIRGVAWEITFPEWLAVWQDSGHAHQRGVGRHGYCMSRHGDAGPYKVGNVSIKSCSQNSREGIEVARPAMRAGKKHITAQLGKGRGWTYRDGHKNPYQVVVSKKFVGNYANQKDAEAAYRSAVIARHESLSVG